MSALQYLQALLAKNNLPPAQEAKIRINQGSTKCCLFVYKTPTKKLPFYGRTFEEAAQAALMDETPLICLQRCDGERSDQEQLQEPETTSESDSRSELEFESAAESSESESSINSDASLRSDSESDLDSLIDFEPEVQPFTVKIDKRKDAKNQEITYEICQELFGQGFQCLIKRVSFRGEYIAKAFLKTSLGFGKCHYYVKRFGRLRAQNAASCKLFVKAGLASHRSPRLISIATEICALRREQKRLMLQLN